MFRVIGRVALGSGVALCALSGDSFATTTHLNTASTSAAGLRSTSDRSASTAAQEQALASLDDPSQLARANALTDILASGDPILRDAALHKIAASTDKELKAVALRWLLARAGKSYIFTFDQCGGSLGMSQDQVNSDCGIFARNTGNSFPMVMKITDPSDGSFSIYSTQGSLKDNGAYRAGPGRVIGDRVQFSVDLSNFSGGWDNICAGSFKMDADANMQGSLSCGRIIVGGKFSFI